MARIICILPEPVNLNIAAQSLEVFTNSGFLNFAIVIKSVTNDVQYLIIQSMLMKMVSIKNPQKGLTVFPEKLRNMNGYSYRIPIYHQPPRVITKKFISSPMLYLFHALKKVQNAQFRLNILQNYSMLQPLWVQRKMHLTFNTATIFDTAEPKLMTYEEGGFCAFIPIPPKFSLTQLIFVKPFDGFTWTILILSSLASVAVWLMFRKRGAVDSPWFLAYGIFVHFIGQGVDFSRKNRTILIILVQLIIVMIWILSNVYEGVITSFMVYPIYENRLRTVKDLLDSDFDIITDEAFAFKVSYYDEFQAIKPRINTSGIKLNSFINDLITGQKYVLIKSCEKLEDELSFRLPNQRLYADYYYILPEKITSQFVELEASYMNPFLERLQYYMDLSFQAGLMHMWMIYSYRRSYHKSENNANNDLAYIELGDLSQVFYILLIGNVMATFVLLIELFFHDCLRDLNLQFQTHRLRNRVQAKAYNKRISKNPKYQRGALYYIIHRHKKSKRLQRGRLKIRKIMVQPRNQNY